ncbi:MAG TPA: DUF4340 domain-containing protein [Burkholderiales bacterium]|nr:DUF4340 domain-containing protein [Burkholderiales bacterium]
MNARVAVVLVVLLAALGGGALLLYRKEGSQSPASAAQLGQPVLAGLQAADIQSIEVREPGATLTLLRRPNGWVVAERANFPADVDKVRELVLAAIGLKVGQVEKIAEKDRAGLQLDASGTRLEFRGEAGKPLAALIVGKKYFKREPRDAATAAPDGRFVRVPESAGTALVVADPLRLASAKSAPWVSKEGFGAELVRTMEVDSPADGKWRISRTKDDTQWKLTPLYAGEKLDVIRANSASYSLHRVAIDDVAPPGLRPDETGLDKPVTVVASTFDALTYTLKLGKLRGDDYYAMVWVAGEPKVTGPDAEKRAKQIAERLPREHALEGQVLLISRHKFEDVLKKRSEMLDKKDPAKK